MIVIAEITCTHFQHSPFNAGLLSTVRLAHPREKVIFCAEENHLNDVRSLLLPEISSSIEFHYLDVPDLNADYFKRIGQDYINIKKCLRLLEKREQKTLLFCNVKPSVLLALRIALIRSKIRLEKIKMQVVLHANAKTLKGWRSKRPLKRIQDMRFAVWYVRNLKIDYIVLEQHIWHELYKSVKNIKERIVVLEHPIVGKNTCTENNSQNSRDICLKFGFLGATVPEKGFDEYLDLAQVLYHKFTSKVSFQTVGSLRDMYFQDPRLRYLENAFSTEKIDRTIYESLLNNLDYVVMPYHKAHYQLCASGALLDAISWCKPIIAFSIPLFSNLEKRFGPIGLLCRDYTEMLRKMGELIINNDDEQYYIFCQTMEQIRKSRMPSALAHVYAAM